MPKHSDSALQRWANTRAGQRPRQDQGTVAFLAVRQEVQAGLQAGYALKTIWRFMHETGKVQTRYETFLKHARRHLDQPTTGSAATPVSALPAPQPVTMPAQVATKLAAASPLASSGAAAPTVATVPMGLTGFTYNAVPNKEELF